MGLFFKRIEIEFLAELEDGSVLKGKIHGGGTIFTSMTEIYNTSCDKIKLETGSAVKQFMKFKATPM
jgi:hypothetical protein